jgi:sugar lactone lactonase YvrE
VRIPLASDAAGNLHATNSLAGTIVKFTPGGTGSLFATTGLNTPFGLAFDSTGDLYAANHDNNTIMRFTPDGVGSVFANTGLDGPMFIAIQVPEPSMPVLLGLGILALPALRR